MMEKSTYTLDTMMPTPEEGASKDEIACYVRYLNDSTLAPHYRLSFITPELQRQHKKINARFILFSAKMT